MEYTHTRTIESPGFTVRVYSPVISSEERIRRMKAIRKAAENLMKEVHKK